MNMFCQAQIAFIVRKAEVSELELDFFYTEHLQDLVNDLSVCFLLGGGGVVCDGRIDSGHDSVSFFAQMEALGLNTCHDPFWQLTLFVFLVIFCYKSFRP